MSDYTPAEVFPPGEFIKEELDARGWTQSDLATIIARPLQAVNEVISGKRGLTADTARALGEAFETGPELWMNLESAWRLSKAGKADDAIRKRAKLFNAAPVKELVRRRWIRDVDEYDQMERQVLSFMGMSCLDDTPQFNAAARMSTDYAAPSPSHVAWLRKAEQISHCVTAKPFAKKRFLMEVRNIRDLAINEADVRRIPRFLSDIGVRLVVVEHLQGTKMDGAAFWIDSRKPVVALTMRYDRIDYLWHTLGHELGHIANGDGKTCYCDDDIVNEDVRLSDKPDYERVADSFAVELLVPQDELDDFIARVGPLYSKKRIVGFANRIGVHPGIVVGQLQHRGEIGYWHSRPLLSKVRSSLLESSMPDGWGHSQDLCTEE